VATPAVPDAVELTDAIAELTARVRRLEAVDAVRRLHNQYGYYLDKCLYDEVVALFSRDCEMHFVGGIYRGIEGIKRVYLGRFRERFTHGHNGPVHGFLLDHVMLQDVVTVAEDGLSAKARMRTLMQAGIHESAMHLRERVSFEQWWEGGMYENSYVVEDGVWKIQTLGYHALWHGDHAKGWTYTAPMNHILPTATYPEDPIGPDEITPYEFFPAADTVPFHYPHPVTGATVDGRADRSQTP